MRTFRHSEDMTRRNHLDTLQWLDDAFRVQDGLITYAQLISMGIPHSTIADRIGPFGPWQKLLPGVYLSHKGTATDWQRRRAALLYTGAGGVISGSEVLRLHAFRYVPVDSRVRVLLPDKRRRVSTGFVIVERTWRPPEAIDHRGLAFAPVDRAVMDTCRQLDDRRAVQAIIMEAVQRGVCTVDQLATELAEGPIRGSWRPRLAVEQARHGLRSPAEVDACTLFRREGLPEAVWNVALYTMDGQHLAIPDAYFPDAGVVFEVDSREHHSSVEDWEHTMRRHARMTALGLLVIHASPHQIVTDGPAVAAQVKQALQQATGRPLPPVTTTPPAYVQ